MCRKLISQIQNLRRTRDLLLPRLLSGQLAISPEATGSVNGGISANAEKVRLSEKARAA
jgi:hypothetical protein